jgi:nucleotide-binding universal stress UspA family protein
VAIGNIGQPFNHKGVPMLPNFKKILYATDLSNNSRLALGYAASIAKQFQAELLVLHAIEPINPYAYSSISGVMGDGEWMNIQANYENKMVDEIGAKLRVFCSQMHTTTDEIALRDENILVRHGTSVDIILQMAKELEVNLIVMGTHGYGMVKDALMGGTARRIVRRSEIPVMVVRSKEED